MTLFWILSAVMIAAAVLLIAPSLLRTSRHERLDRDAQNITIARERLAELDGERESGRLSDEEYNQTRRELEQALMQDLQGAQATTSSLNHPQASGRYGKYGLLGIAVLLPLLSVLLYQQLGNPALIDMPMAPDTAKAKTEHSSGKAPIGSMAELALKLRQRLEEKTPEDADGWFLLGRTYMTMKDYAEAARAFERAHRLTGDQPHVMLALADALTMSSKGDMSGRPAELVSKALAIAPDNTTALWMSGMIAADEGSYNRALELWTRLHPLLAAEPEEQQQLEKQIASVAAAAGVEPPPLAGKRQPLPRISDATPAQAEVTLRLTLSGELAQRSEADDTLFVYAKAMQGPRFPVAAARYRVSDLPLEITLNDSHAVMPSAKLSDFNKVRVGARISRSGDAMTQSGDLLGEVDNISVKDGAVVDIIIDHIIP